jgi:hypothetical protein
MIVSVMRSLLQAGRLPPLRQRVPGALRAFRDAYRDRAPE